MRRALLHNRRDVNRRESLHDLDAAADVGSAVGSFGLCDPCGDCKRGGQITECEHCRQATSMYAFSFPSLAAIVQGGAGSQTEYTVEWASECLWETDNIPVNCSGVDQFGFALEISGRNPGDVALTASRRIGSNCAEVEFVYRNFFPLRCLCPLPMFLDPESLIGIEADQLPCSVCVRPTYQHCLYGPQSTCGCPENWAITIGSDVIETQSGPLSGAFGLTHFEQFSCSWWSTRATGGLWTVFSAVAARDFAFGTGTHTLRVTQHNTAPQVNAFGNLTTGPTIRGWVGARGGTPPVSASSCFANCGDGQELSRYTGAGPDLITVAHLSG